MNAIAYTIVNTPKRRLIKTEIFVLVALLVAYMALVGSVVSKSVAKEKLKLELARELEQNQEMQGALHADGMLLSSLIAHGYEEPQSLEVIKRKHNVAQNAGIPFY